MPKSLRKQELAATAAPERPALQSVKKQKLTVFLVTGDETLWPQVGADLGAGLALKQVDSIEELINSTQSGQPAIVVWDARDHADPADVLSQLNLHSSRFAIVALDADGSADAWTLPIQHRQIVGHVGLPIVGSILNGVLDNAQEEVNSRLALLGEATADAGHSDSAGGSGARARKSWIVPAIIGGVLVAAAAAYVLTRGGSSGEKSAAALPAAPDKTPAASAGAATASKPAADVDEKVDALIEKAQQAMLDRHFIDPLAGSALSLYREVLIINPDNGEARQGLQRLAEILIARVQSALDDRKFDVALQFLETARSIDATDRRLSALDEKIASLRAEIGPAQILAAINAQNFDRATQLIDEAARSKALPPAKLAQLRDEVHRRTIDAEVGRLLKLVDTRAQQDHILDPRNDSALYYLDQAKQAGATAPAMQSEVQDLAKRMTQMAHAAIQQHNFGDADKILTEMHNIAAPQASISAVQRELSAARNPQTPQKPEQPQFMDLAQSRLALGRLTDPENDNALYYVNQQRVTDPKTPGLAQMITTLQAQILDRARAALDAGDMEKSEALVQKAGTLGASSDLDAMNDRIRQRKAAGGDLMQVPEQSLTRLNKMDIQYPTRALQANVEGWVELTYTVGPDGSVSNIKVLNSTPPRTFEASASRAVGHLRYQPVMQNGKAVAVATQVRIVYRVPK